MKAGNGHPVSKQLWKLYEELVVPALSEGGLDFMREEFILAEWATDSFRVTVGDYDFASEIAPAPGENEDDPKVGQIIVELALGRCGPRVTFLRRTDEMVWRVTGRGTLCLPTGHPLGELAHRDDLLGLEAQRMEKELDDKASFQLLKKVGYIVQHNTL